MSKVQGMGRIVPAVALTMGFFFSAGCVMGPTALEISRVRYNEVIEETSAEQLLLNLVRLRYRDSPLFLAVSSVSAQFNLKESASADGRINEGPTEFNPDLLNLGGGVSYEEKPTITFSPLQGSDFVNQLLAPIPVDVMILLSRSGWSIDRVFRLTAQSMNGVDNAAAASGPTPKRPPNYQRFAEITRAFRSLQEKGLLRLGYESRATAQTVPLPVETNLGDVVSALNDGYTVRRAEDGRELELERNEKTLVWVVPESADGGEDVERIREILGLDPSLDRYEIKVGAGERTGPGLVGERKLKQINVLTRSLMGTLFYLSQAIEVPDVHRNRGYVTTTREEGSDLPFDWRSVMGDLLRVTPQRSRPMDAAVAVRYRGYWFSIGESDLESKTTFALLMQLSALQAGRLQTTGPVLTLPVGG